MAKPASAYPLAWPFGRPRSKARIYGRFGSMDKSNSYPRFDLSVSEARTRLLTELDRLRAAVPAVISTNISPRNGKLTTARSAAEDPGVAVYFQLKGKSVVLACDRYTKVEQNIAAIAAHLAATRAIERYGVATTEQMFAGFTALPAPIVIDDWRGALDYPDTLAAAEATFKRKIRSVHPDASTDQADLAQAKALTEAIARARKELR